MYVTWHISNIFFFIKEVNSDMPIYMNRTNAGNWKSNAPSEIRTHDTPISWKVLGAFDLFSSICSVYIDRHIRVDLSDDVQII